MLVLSPWPSTEYSCCSRAAAEESSSTVKLSQEGSVSACLHRGDLYTTAGGNSCHLKSARSCTISWPGGTTGMKMPFSSSLVQGMSEMATCMETWRGHTAWLLTADLHEVVVLPHHAVNLHTPLTVRQSDQNIGHI